MNYGGFEMFVCWGILIYRGCGLYLFGGKLVSLILNKIYLVLIVWRNVLVEWFMMV